MGAGGSLYSDRSGSEPIQIPMDQLKIVRSCFSDEKIEITSSRGKREKKKIIRAQVQQMTVAFCRLVVLTLEKQPGYFLYQCLDERLMKAKLLEIPHATLLGAFETSQLEQSVKLGL